MRQIRTLELSFKPVISIHAPLAGCDVRVCRNYRHVHRFQSTHPLRGATGTFTFPSTTERYFNPRTPCGVRRQFSKAALHTQRISIHAPLAGCDIRHARSRIRCQISIHAPLAGCDRVLPPCIRQYRHFNPRTPCGVRRSYKGGTLMTREISIHAPLAGCDFRTVHAGLPQSISIHAPLAGCDFFPRAGTCCHTYFNPRTPCGVRR